jgi:hypothetical protein
MRPSQIVAVREWLGQFPDASRSDAAALVDAILTIGHDLFASQLRELIVERVGQGPGLLGYTSSASNGNSRVFRTDCSRRAPVKEEEPSARGQRL